MPAETTEAPPHGLLAHHFRDLTQQREVAQLGMWVFLASEILFFGALFVGYTSYRVNNEASFAAASRELSAPLGAFNTAVLLTSSLTMAMAVYSSTTGSRRGLHLFLWLTLILGTAFLCIKAYEWYSEYQEQLVPGIRFNQTSEKWEEPGVDVRAVQMFYVFYFIITGLHALHMIIGLGVLIGLIAMARGGRFTGLDYMPIEITGLYWHFVDVVWIFVFPILYLLRQ